MFRIFGRNKERFNEEDDREYEERSEEHVEEEIDEEQEEFEQDNENEEQERYEQWQPEQEYYEEPNRKALFFSIAMIAILITATVYIYFNYIKPYQSVSDKSEALVVRTEDFVELLYDVAGVEEIIANHESVKRYTSETLHSKFDVSNSEVYLDRYEDFSNAKISITSIQTSLTEQTKEEEEVNKNRKVITKYVLETGLGVPTTRIAYMTFNEKGIIIDFEEYVSYTVVD